MEDTREMNANELADAMEIRASIRRKATSRKSVQENANDRLADQLEQAATMLRQQQAEIDLLRMTQPNIDYDKELLKPLFVGRELTDEEIDEVSKEIFKGYKNFYHYQINFARAILRKAQEK